VQEKLKPGVSPEDWFSNSTQHPAGGFDRFPGPGSGCKNPFVPTGQPPAAAQQAARCRYSQRPAGTRRPADGRDIQAKKRPSRGCRVRTSRWAWPMAWLLWTAS